MDRKKQDTGSLAYPGGMSRRRGAGGGCVIFLKKGGERGGVCAYIGTLGDVCAGEGRGVRVTDSQPTVGGVSAVGAFPV